jgi:hypothetical protein
LKNGAPGKERLLAIFEADSRNSKPAQYGAREKIHHPGGGW